ncbi:MULTISPECIES: DUF2846 domain-containing protein [unclassified Bradyrhizobium]|uniref:DUF2846 domain-containing protein n=1 Tax=unclassified Bradyrhizobium TaxID=2631580 RepID=UPI0028F038E1|nr:MULTISPECIES: DUF2846 domain-containing protein [unclassified Bradyrhizobium]
MVGRGAGLGLAALLLSGCATDKVGADYAAAPQRFGQPPAGKSRVVLLATQKKGLLFQGTICDVTLDGAAVGPLKIGTYIHMDAPAGHHQLGATQTLFPGETKTDIMTQTGRVYFFLAQPSQRSKAVSTGAMVGGVAGALVTSAVSSGSDNPGPIDFVPLDEAAARSKIEELQLADAEGGP